jgi:hypothetical protein
VTTHLVRHRYVGEDTCIVELPTRDGLGLCGLAQFSSVHYSDGDHPFAPSEALGGCGWRLQTDGGLQYCGLSKENPVHVPSAEEAVAAATEGGVWRVRPRDLGESDMASARVTPPDEHVVYEMAEERRVVAERRAMAQDWLSGCEVPLGPWPVRQWEFPTEAAPEDLAAWRSEVTAFEEALWGSGLTYDKYVWWGKTGRVVRYVWADAVGMDEDGVAAALADGRWAV